MNVQSFKLVVGTLFTAVAQAAGGDRLLRDANDILGAVLDSGLVLGDEAHDILAEMVEDVDVALAVDLDAEVAADGA
jgi:hypothetical protein